MITVVGGTSSQRKYAYSMAQFVCNKFNINPDIEISFRRLTNCHSLGGCVDMGDNEYEIDIKRSLRMRDMLTTLAHELVHVKQYELGELTQDNEAEYDYWDKPSEIEAHGRETGLFVTWAEQNNLGNKKWTQING
jgi:hypothetical protein